MVLVAPSAFAPIASAPKHTRILLWHPDEEAWVIGYWGRCATLPYADDNAFGLSIEGWVYGDDPETAVMIDPPFWSPIPVLVGAKR